MIRVGLLAGLLCASPAAADVITPADFADLAAADVVILGEIHDNPAHHANQAVAVAALAPKAIVFEMLTPDQAALVPDDRTDAARLEAVLGWNASGWPDFAMYHPIFTAAPNARIYGGDLPAGATKLAVRSGAAAGFGADAALYGLAQPLDPEDQSARQLEQAEAHCYQLPASMLPGMVQVQRLRDAGFARAVVQAMRDTGGPVVVITGTGHARTDTGMPVPLRAAAPNLRVLSIGQFEADPGPDAPYDHWLVTPALPREDPCLAFSTAG